MTLLHPLWLAALPGLLLLWWVRPRGGRERPVAALFLWQGAIAGGRGRRLALRPGGVRVPLLLALLCLCLAAPQGHRTAPDHGAPPATTGVVCEGEVHGPLRAYLADLDTPCVATSPWTVVVRPGDGSATVRWAVEDPLLVGAPADPVAGHGLRTVAAGAWDRVLADTVAGPVVVLHPTNRGGRLVVGADLDASPLRDAPALPLLFAAWAEEIRGAVAPPPPPGGAPRWRWPAIAALSLLWLPWPRRPLWAAAATLPLAAALLLPAGGGRAVVLDISPSSTGGDLTTALEEATAGARRVAVVAAGGEAEVWVPAGSNPGHAVTAVRRLLATPRPPSRATALGAAVVRAATLASEVVVVSDGRAAPVAPPPPGVRLHCRLLPSAGLTLHLPSRLPEGGTTVAVARLSGIADARRVVWRIDGETAGESTVVAGEARLPLALPPGRHRIEATAGGVGATTLIDVEGGPRVVVVGDTALARLAGVEPVAPASLAHRLATAPPAALVAAGLPAGAAVRSAIARAVAAGMGLLVVGPPEVPTPDDPLSRILPLRPRQEAGRPPVAVVVVLDRSGSMAEGGAPLDLGVAAAMAVRRGLGPEDRWGLIAFDRDVHLLDPLGPPPAAATLRHRLARLTSAGGTDPWRAVAAAEALLAAAPEEREIVLITDGRVGPPKAAPVAGVRITAIQVGARPAEARLERLCDATGGRLLRAATAAELPTALLRAAPGGAPEVGPFPLMPAAADTPFPLPANRTISHRWPARLATGRPLLLAGNTPLLAIGRHGLGRIAQWVGPATELTGRADLLHPLLAWLAPRPGGVETTIADDHLWVGVATAEAAGDPPPCTLRSAITTERPLPLHQVAGGWSGEATLTAGGRWAVEVGSATGAIARRLVEVGDPEWAISPAAGKARLARLARATGGRLLTQGEPPPPPPAAPAPPLHPLLLAAAALLLSPRAAPPHRH